MKNWAEEMESLYQGVQSGEVAIEKAEALANICGKALKFEALKFAKEVFANTEERRGRPLLRNQEDGQVVSTQ